MKKAAKRSSNGDSNSGPNPARLRQFSRVNVNETDEIMTRNVTVGQAGADVIQNIEEENP
jgi:hypothetical protein